METKLKMDFIVDTDLLLLNEDNIKNPEKKSIKLVLDEESIMKILFRFSSSEPFVLYDTDNNFYRVNIGFDNKELTQMTFLYLTDTKNKNYMVGNYPDFILDLVEAFIQIHSIGKVTALLASTIKSNKSDNEEEVDYNNIPDEFELPGIEDYEDNDNEYDREYYYNENTPFDNKDTDYSESNDF